MIIGRVNEYNEAMTPVQMRGSNRRFEVIIDTGFQGADLLLPRDVIIQLGLTPAGDMVLDLANEQEATFNFYNDEVMWHRGFRQVKVLESADSSLASADLLAGSRIIIDMTPGGMVFIAEMFSG